MFRVDLDTINTEDFNVSQRDYGWYLIVPKRSKYTWEQEELKYRSLLVDSDGHVLSSGFPKFFNFGEDGRVTQKYLDLVQEGESVPHFMKEDGSLIIADNINGQLHIRTRGNHNLGDFHEPVMDLIQTWYPYLRNANNLDPKYSYLFEYISPRNRIIVDYHTDALVGIGMVDKTTLTPVLDYDRLTYTFGSDLGVVPMRRLHMISERTVQDVTKWEHAEGVVAWVDGELLKIKSDWYFYLHQLRFQMTPKRMFKYCYLNNISSWNDLAAQLVKSGGYDYEALTMLEPIWADYQRKYRNMAVARNWIHDIVTSLVVKYADYSVTDEQISGSKVTNRKAFVESLRNLMEKFHAQECLFHVGMKLLDGKTEEADAILAGVFLLDTSPVQVLSWLRNVEQEKQLEIYRHDEDE